MTRSGNGSAASRRTVGVVVVNYNGGDLTLECLRSIVRTEWPAAQLRVVLVDNASSDGIAARVSAELPVVRVLEQPSNDGFGAGCNAGIRALGDVDLVALVNNDAIVDPGWLRPLVDTLTSDEALGAACPKILFAGRFFDVELRSATSRRGFGDGRDLGVFLSGARVNGDDVWSRVQLVDGTWGLEPDAPAGGEWTGPRAHVRVPAPVHGEPATLSLLLSADGPRAISLQAGAATVEHTVGAAPAWYDVPVAAGGVAIVNNAGTDLRNDGFAADRGYLQRDDGRFDTPSDVFAWCGAGVLLRREYLDDVGLFDDELFVYYEDLELAWRGNRRGWRYRYVPDSVVHHVHAATSGRGSPLKQFYDERNRLLVLARHGTPAQAAAGSFRSLLVTASYVRRDVIAPVLSGRSPAPSVASQRLRAWLAFAVRVPRSVRQRTRADAHRRART
jgi:GT2 family glycosyltransferase